MLVITDCINMKGGSAVLDPPYSSKSSVVTIVQLLLLIGMVDGQRVAHPTSLIQDGILVSSPLIQTTLSPV